jgi:hypothetical protein
VQQLEIYREQFWLRHTSSLVEDFPGLGGVMGQADWEKLIENYLTETTPTSWTLRNLGDRLPEHVERATWLEHHEVCVDMARLEWLYIELFDAPSAPPLEATKIASIAPEAWTTAIVVTSPALRLLGVRYPVADLRRELRLRPDEPVPIPEPGPQNLALYRAANRSLYHKPLGRGAFELLLALTERVPLVAAAERAATRAPDDAPEIEANVGAWFQDWGRLGWVVDVEIPD